MNDNLPAITNTNSLEAYEHNMERKLKMAGTILKSGMVPKHFTTAEAVLGAILFGQELGFSPMRAVNLIYVVNGKPSLEAAGLIGLAIANGGRIETVKQDDSGCILRCTRGDWKEEMSFSMEDAKRAGLTTKEVWQKYPRDMCYNRAATRLVRRMFADVVGGLQGREEMEDSPPPINVTPKMDVRPPSPLDAVTKCIQDKNFTALGLFVITSECVKKGMTIVDACADEPWLKVAITKQAKKLEPVDRIALQAYSEYLKSVTPEVVPGLGTFDSLDDIPDNFLEGEGA